MRKRIAIASVILLFVFIAGGWSIILSGQSAEQARIAASQGEFIRFHVIANSDSFFDQTVKIKVRDAVLDYLYPKLKAASSVQAAREIIDENREAILTITKRVLDSNGIDYGADIKIGRYDFPLKVYGEITVPAGNYEAVRILLGQASGKNWWCVLFPPLCFIDINTTIAAQPVAATVPKTEELNPESKIEIKWKLTEFWQK